MTGSKRRSMGGRVWEWTKSIAVALVIWYILTSVAVQAFRIPSGSMERTLFGGDFLFANKALYGAELPIINKRLPAIREPRRFDIVIFDSVDEPNVNVVKRIVGVPGDTVAMNNNHVTINSELILEPHVVRGSAPIDPTDPRMRDWQTPHYVGDDANSYRPTLKNWGPLVVPQDSFFVMGDNRDNSLDSRYWGFLGRDRIRGRPMFVYYSYDRDAGLPFPFLTSVRWGRLLARPR